MRWPIILLTPPPGSSLPAEYSAMHEDALEAARHLAEPGSLHTFDVLYTDRLDELRILTTQLRWRIALASPILNQDGKLDRDALMERLGPGASRALFCWQSGEDYIVETCWRCQAACQGIVDESGCDCCRDEEDPVGHVCDCTEGDGFELACRCPMHNFNQFTSDQLGYSPG